MTEFVKTFFKNKEVHNGNGYVDIYQERSIYLPKGMKNPKNI